MSAHAQEQRSPVISLVPARMDRLPWTKFHWSVVIGLGVSWILDGLEIQLVSAGGFQHEFKMSAAQVGFTATVYLIGQIVGALVFGRMTDTIGRKRLFILTLAIYLAGSGLAGLSLNMWMLFGFRFIAGMGIGGEYTAINSAIDELIPSRYRGRVDIAVNGTYWAGAALGAVATIATQNLFSDNWAWRIGFFVGPVLGLVIIYLRRHIPESPRWLLTHGHAQEADRTVDDIEAGVEAGGIHLEPVPKQRAMAVVDHPPVPFGLLVKIFFQQYPRRTVLGLTMMITQSFLYNAIFFSQGNVLKGFYGVSEANVGYFFFPFAIGNLLGPLVLGHFFDTIGRRKMIFGTYLVSGLVLALSALLFQAGLLNATTQTVFWCVSFFFASAGASSAYLTVSEIFPLEVRGQAISYFFCIGQAAGSVAPVIYGVLMGDFSSRGPLTVGYFIGAALMIVGGLVALTLGVNAEGQGLEDVADPLSKVDMPDAA